MSVPQIGAFRKERFTGPLNGSSRRFDVYVRGAGPPVVIMQELPGIGQETLLFADKLVGAGFEVWLPHLFGPLGRTSMGGNLVRVLCMQREFQIFAKHKSSAAVEWMRALCRHVRDVRGVKGVGCVGMCLTGNFALAMIADEAVLAAVASQPSLPVRDETALHMSDAEVAASRTAIDAKGPMRAYRFADDPLCTAARFDTIAKAFNDDRERVILRALPGGGHSVFARDFVDDETGPTAQALKEIIAYFGERLRS